MEDTLYCEDLHDPIEGDKAKPSNMSNVEWELINRKTVALIRQWIDDTLFHHVALETNAESLWRELANLFERKAPQTKISLVKKLVHLRYKEGDSMAKHMTDFQDVLDQLSNLELVLSDELQAYFFLSTLPNVFEFLGDSAPDDRLSLSMIKERLFVEEIRREEQLRNRGEERKEDNGTINFAVQIDDVKMAQEVEDLLKDSWIFACCSFHVSSNRNWFDTINASHKGYVTLANGDKLEIEGIGNVKVRMHDGKRGTFSDVRYVPKFHGNLISITRLTSRGFEISAGRGVMEVCKDGLLMMKGERTNIKLYKLEGSTLVASMDGNTRDGARGRH